MKIGLLGCSPLPNSEQRLTNFAQLRTWSIQKFLHSQNLEVSSFLVSNNNSHGWNVYENKTLEALSNFSKDIDILVTAGPFLPSLVLDAVPKDIPIWLDWPSDPLADLHAKRLVSKTNVSDESIVQELIHNAFSRADAIGVISLRQQWATLGQLLLLGFENIPISTIPIAYDFPFQPKPKNSAADDILITGSMNTWLNLEQIVQTLSEDSNRKIHLTGGAVSHFPEGDKIIQKLQTQYPQFIHHGWLAEMQLQEVLQQCQYSAWLDQGRIEPLLGSRTRALFAIWNGMKIFGSAQTELAEFLVRNQAMLKWNGRESPSIVFSEISKIKIPQAQSICQQYFSPDIVYAPLLEWIRNPIKIKKQKQNYPFEENQRLRRRLREIYQSKTWKITNRIHKLFFSNST